MSAGFGLILVLALVFANAFFVAAEFALVSARKTRLEEMAHDGNRKATLALRAVQSLDRVISATQLGITLASLGLGSVGEPAVARIFASLFTALPAAAAKVATHGVAVAVAFTLITVLHILLGELVPKAIALLHAEVVATWLAPPLLGFAWVMHYPISMLRRSANRLVLLLGLRPLSEREPMHSPEEIRLLVEHSGESGSLEASDARLLEGVFEFSEKTAEEVMTPRTEMVTIEADMAIAAAADVVARAGRSRYPVYRDSLDEIVGVVHAKDILRALREAPSSAVRDILREPLFVPGTREVEDVLADMKRLKSHLAVVLDEYGGTAGLVTMEDLLEEIVGEIYDEHDRVRQAARASDDGAIRIDGATTVGDFNDRFDAHLDDTDYTTIGGFLFGQFGRLPKQGDRVSVDRFTFEIAEMSGRRVAQIKVIEQGEQQKVPPTPSS
ncbi:MAG TPA: hemolysin family protein [Gemmatimonadales bacterium]|jgi:CBS domain containing-hemolysin-like protein